MIAKTVEDVTAALRLGAAEPLPEGRSLLQHHLACAETLAEWRPWDVELQLAALAHDVGHTLSGYDQAHHGAVGSRFVRDVLGSRVAGVIETHVTAERYFATVQPSYLARLSDPGRDAFRARGGALTPPEVERFERSPHYADALLLVRAHERSRLAVPSATLAEWMPLMREHAARVARHVAEVGGSRSDAVLA